MPPIDDLVSVDIGQGYPDTCGIRSQQLILRDFGKNFLQEELMAEAIEKGWYRVDGTEGTPMFAVGNLLEAHGIGVSRYVDASVDDLLNAAAQGKKIIIAVDSGELWGEKPLDASENDVTPDHALIVAGIDTSDPENAMVILTDPGTGHVAQSYPLDVFKPAWDGGMMVVTNDPVPNLDNFDYENGHILTQIDGMDYDDWHAAHADDLAHANIVGYATIPGGPIDAWTYDYDGDGIVDQVVRMSSWADFPDFGGMVSAGGLGGEVSADETPIGDAPADADTDGIAAEEFAGEDSAVDDPAVDDSGNVGYGDIDDVQVEGQAELDTDVPPDAAVDDIADDPFAGIL